MKFILFYSIFFLVSLSCFSQNSKFSTEVTYPLLVGNNELTNNLNGVVEIGVNKYFTTQRKVNTGISFHAAKFAFKDEAFKIGQGLYSLRLGFFAELNLPEIPQFHPYFGIGYVPFLTRDDFGTSFAQHNADLKIGTNYTIYKGLFVKAEYNFIKTMRFDGRVSTSENRSYHAIKIGFGYRF